MTETLKPPEYSPEVWERVIRDLPPGDAYAAGVFAALLGASMARGHPGAVLELLERALQFAGDAALRERLEVEIAGMRKIAASAAAAEAAANTSPVKH